MDNDKAFAVFALLLLTGVLSVITAVVVSGGDTWPTPMHLAEHVAMGFTWRAAYKWIGGFDGADWSLGNDHVADLPADLLPSGATADAMG